MGVFRELAALESIAPSCPSCAQPMTPTQLQPEGAGGRLYYQASFVCGQCPQYVFQHVTAQLVEELLRQQAEPAPKDAPEPPPLINGSVIGYRAWRIVDWRLYGTGVNRAWEPGVNEATCDAAAPSDPFSAIFTTLIVSPAAYGKHTAPSPGCHCGINALARFTQQDDHWKAADVFGAIEAWGENEVSADVAKPGNLLAELEAIPTAVKPVDLTPGAPHPKHDHQGDDQPAGFHLHRNGFRAKYGKVVLLAIEDDWPNAKKAAVRALAAEHGGDVCKREHLEDAAKEHGQLVSDELLEWVAKTEPPDVYSFGGLGGYFMPSYLPQYVSIYMPRVTRPNRRKAHKPGICQTLGYPGPPANPTIKFSKGQRVKDSKTVVWVCVKGGKPGLWEREDEPVG